jgi:Caspase domain
VGQTDLENRPATIHLRRSGVTIAAQAPNPSLYAVVVGIGEYGMKDLRLKGDFPARDAGKFAEEFERQQGRAFSRVVAHVLTDKDATNDKILRELDWLQNQGDADDVALFYFSGHGNVDHLLPVNFDGHATVTGIDKSVVIRALRQVRGRKVLFIDACQAAGGLLDLESLVTEAKSSRNGIIVVVSSNSDEASAGEAQSNSYFTTAVLEALDGKAARPGNNEVETAGLNAYLVWRVPDLSGGKQNSAVYMPFNAKPLRLSVPQNSTMVTSP